MQNDDEALLSTSLACHGQVVKMLITRESHGIFFLSNCAYIYILRLSSVYQTKLNKRYYLFSYFEKYFYAL